MYAIFVILNFVRRVRLWIWTLNFYTNNSNDSHEIETGRISTRISILILIASLVSLTFYSGISKIEQNFTINNPTFSEYLALVEKFPDSICACSTLTIPYSAFIRLNPYYHQVCSSDLISARFSAFLAWNSDQGGDYNDWRRISLAQFNLLASLCEMSQNAVNDAIKTFNDTRLIVSQVSLESLFKLQSQVITDGFIVSTQNEFARSLDLNNVLTQGNLLLSGLGTNYYGYAKYWNDWYSMPVQFYPYFFMDENHVWHQCTQKERRTFLAIARINSTLNYTIPGWRIACYVDIALFASTLECYYNISCMSILRTIYEFPLDIQILQVMEPSRFEVTTKIGIIARQLFIEDWLPTFNFTNYYVACAPSTCINNIVTHRTFANILTTIVGLLGGLSKAVDLVIPRIVQFARLHGLEYVRKLKSKWNTETTNSVSAAEHY